jgi:hypothetical protein
MTMEGVRSGMAAECTLLAMSEVAGFLLENAVGAVARMIVGVVIAGALGTGVIAAVIALSRKGKWLHIGAPFDPWPGRVSFALWIVVALPAFAIAGGVVGLGFAVQHAVEENRVTERVAHTALRGLVTHVLADEKAKQYVDGNWIKIVDVNAFFEAAPQALDNFTHEGAEAAVRATGIESGFVKLSARVAATVAGWIVKSEAADRLRIITPVLADLKTRDSDSDGRVAVQDVLDSAVRIHLEPRAAHFARELVAGQALAPGAVGFAALFVPLVACTVVRRKRAKSPAPAAPATPAAPAAPAA